MTHSQLEHASIIMEVVAFFFVTIDLYGKERLTVLREKIRSAHIPSKDELYDKSNNYDKLFTTYHTVTGIVFSIIIWRFSPHLSKPEDYMSPNIAIEILKKSFGVLLFCIRMILTISTGALIPVLIFFCIVNAIILTLNIIIKMLAHRTIDGMMLTFGAILFIIAKAIAYFCV